MWLGTFGGGLNLAIKTADGYQFKHFLQDNYGEKRIRVIEEDKNGRMWVGTNNGIYIFHPDSLIASPKNYVIYNHANGTFPSNEIRCLMNDDKGNMWIGTSGAGFAVCHPGDSYQHTPRGRRLFLPSHNRRSCRLRGCADSFLRFPALRERREDIVWLLQD